MEQSRLTAKEIEVLALIAQGHDAKSAARELNVSTHTIYERLKRARERLGASNSREAARLFFGQSGTMHPGQFETTAPLHDIARPLGGQEFGNWPATAEPGTPAESAGYEAISVRLHLERSLPLRSKNERMFSASPTERLRLIGDLSSRLAVAFVSICLAGLALANLLGS